MTTREVWAVSAQGRATTYHDDKAEALAKVDQLAAPGVEPIAWPIRVEES